MRKCKVFVGNSHPELGKLVCERLGIEPAPCSLKKFANGETSVQIGASVRDEDVYVIQSGSPTVNDHIMELLILVSACRGGSARKITAVIPQFPYSKQCKMKKHRGAITARMLANLLIMAGADHVVSMDLHASQMQGFFTKPVDNLYGGPSLAKWIRENVPDYKDAVVVSKNPGGTKRVTALADSLKINFAMIHTDRRRAKDLYSQNKDLQQLRLRKQSMLRKSRPIVRQGDDPNEEENIIFSNGIQTARIRNGHVIGDEEADEEADEVAMESDEGDESTPVAPSDSYALGGTYDALDSEDEEDEEEEIHKEKLITLVGNVRDRAAIILDDMIDRPGSFISAAEHLVQNCGAKRVYVVATHGIFTGDCLEELEKCEYIHQIIVTNTFPIAVERLSSSKKLVSIDVSPIFAECIRRDHYGESISVLFDSLASI
ncbi:similar to Saccharomyces cerevisiae YKL181W PRS1 5-phospho-ribosyl-1(alpha)- pyrophosphate synthetase, synthesizes PRPP, which is required for nucleotide, histidine, and tryptophan biosynthesis [Maudiozyma barnettii]|uniref:Ribose-phosphate pyrophosphokinase 1 n=1 Tax=Maudiozyma barnettii TaxID=61262 RepID=A0A8H2ZJG1_9SACH|nr:ribose phosphate diphosphokinase subunit PRS1 [Kazachstania barnettii]CAB4256988.1 similar to Saccharomyces cerevisiae YKL181W PRS1 5-phospho-ribosyl-1(alpha)- pyrophosphate synthetase, synthesizes PRPP, which is required for nucleotide, histidine, and tryptophan biosynthesis [Kazachstania barnettii]CAD1779359.1 similar to Saccharomyces cerevisiae YKL181W PRS1 5-phospho-ribosyl-1(alpha)- pyrophosphate synthetase, synthesizes PRPP, which is required for nucleotide, histidine, and tryptophan bio